jgi:trehalose/maltose hydrolase-like predicted phosphorylase
MAGTIDLPVRSFAGMTLGDDELVFAPRLPPNLTRVGFQIRYRGHLVDVMLRDRSLELRVHAGSAPAIHVRVGAVAVPLSAGQIRTFAIGPGSSARDATNREGGLD